MTKEKAIELFKKYAYKHYYYWDAGKKIFSDAWYSQWWDNPNKCSGNPDRRDWMGDEIIEAFNWYLDQVGRDLGYGKGRAKALMSDKEMDVIEKEVSEYCRKKQHDKWERERASKERCDAKKKAHGLDLIKNMKPGEVYMVKFGRDIWGTRGILVQEIDSDEISGFYLDRVTKEVLSEAPEIPGYKYTKPDSISIWPKDGSGYAGIKKGKLEWDGKTFKRTRTYETKYVKFIIDKVENAIIKK